MKKILVVGAEVMPYAATGGLGDVLGSLPKALVKSGEDIDVRVIMPLYSDIGESYRKQMKTEATFNVRLAWRQQYCGILSLFCDGVTYYFIDNEYYFKRNGLYGHFDDGERYAYFCMAVLESMRELDFYPDVLHAHDWHGALAVVYLNLKYKRIKEYSQIKTVFTIHNIEYQGKFNFSILGDVFGLSMYEAKNVEYDGSINLMKAAIVFADKISTVSPRYAEEIQSEQFSHGLFYILRDNSSKLCGILNGIDYDYYNPKTDKALAENYSYENADNKAQNKVALQKELHLPCDENIPMLSIVSRLVFHKGIDLIVNSIYNLIDEKVQLVVLGTGDSYYERFFEELQNRFPDKVRALIKYDREMSRKIYAASDIFLMPSQSEPCGLSQMIASRYGAVPVVHEVGGLYDSIKGYWINNGEIMGNGFTFANYSADVLLDRIHAALALYSDRDTWDSFRSEIMNKDFSWGASAKKYLEIYKSL